MTRTIDQIVARIHELKTKDFFGFERGDLTEFLPFDAAKPFLKDDATADEWMQAGGGKEPTEENVIAVIREYMPFAWDKANGRRGLSAMRSLNHMQAWLWLLGYDEARSQIESYSCYGKPQLRTICEKFEIDYRALDDNDWANSEGGESVEPFAANLDWTREE